MEYGIKYVVGAAPENVGGVLIDPKEHYSLLYIKETGGSLYLNNELIEFAANSLVFVTFGTNLKCNPDDDREFVLIYFSEAFFARSEWDFNFLNNYPGSTNPEVSHRLLYVPEEYQFYYNFVRTHLEMSKKQGLESVLNVLAYNIIKQILLLGAVYLGEEHTTRYMGEDVAAQIVGRFQQLISENVESEKNVSFYADQLKLTPRKLSNYTKEVLSKTPKELITDGLVRLSKRLLANSKLSIKQIAWQLGYTDENNFSSLFSKEAGVTPTMYRNGGKK